MSDPIVIVGAGQAGGRTAAAVRAALPEAPILLVGAERHPPYERPPLSKDLLLGRSTPEQAHLQPAVFWEEQKITLRLGTEIRWLDRQARRLTAADGSGMVYDRLVLATGGRPRRLTIPGGDDPRVRYLRDIDDALALRAAIRPGLHVGIIGGGVIGLEVAASARGLGADVTIIELGPKLLGRMLPGSLGDWFAELHRSKGVTVCTGTALTAIEPATDGLVLRLAGAETLRCDLVVAGIGIVPNTELAAEAGLDVDDGIVTDAAGRTGDPSIFAAGDVARAFHPLLGRHVRLEAWRNAETQARTVAAALAGAELPPPDVPWFWSDQYDLNLQAAGLPRAWDDLVWRGDPAAAKFTVIALEDGVVVGGVAVNQGRDMRPIQNMILAGRPVDRAALENPRIQLAATARNLGAAS